MISRYKLFSQNSFLRKISILAILVLLSSFLIPNTDDVLAAKKRKSPAKQKSSKAVSKPQGDQNTVTGRLNAIVASLAKSDVGVYVYNLDDKSEIYSHNADKLYSLASNEKVLTTSVALETLGYDYKFSTKLYAHGKMNADKSVLTGNLVIVGSGDPGMSPHFYPETGPLAIFDYWGRELKKRGLNEVSGGLVVDANLFDSELVPKTYPKNQLDWWYCAQSSALSFNDNCVDLVIRPGSKQGEPALVYTYPETAYIKIINQATTGSSSTKSNLLMKRKPETCEIVISGKICLKTTEIKESITIHNPHLFTGTLIKERFAAAGIVVKGDVSLAPQAFNPKQENVKLLAEHQTPLVDVVRVCNKRSQNHYAEQLVRVVGAKNSGVGSFENGAQAVKKFMTEKLTIAPDGIAVEDGSGLSRGNKFTPLGMVKLLAYMHAKNGDVFRSTLAIAGVDQSMHKRLKDDMFKEKVWAKSGYINNVSTFSGYLKSKNGKMIAFSILINKSANSNTNNIAIQDKICAELMKSF